MIPTLASISLRGILNRRRTLLLGLSGALLVLIAFLYRLSEPGDAEAVRFTGRLLADFGLAVLLPLVAVIVGTAVIGSELDDGTIIYVLARPVSRALVVVVRWAVAWGAVTALVALPIVLGGLVGTAGDPELAVAYGVAAAFGALEYTAVFVALSLVTSRALVVGLAYVVVWEGVVAGLFAGTRVLSVRQHALAVGDALAGEGAVRAELEPITALVLGMVVAVLALLIAVRRLQGVELRGETA